MTVENVLVSALLSARANGDDVALRTAMDHALADPLPVIQDLVLWLRDVLAVEGPNVDQEGLLRWYIGFVGDFVRGLFPLGINPSTAAESITIDDSLPQGLHLARTLIIEWVDNPSGHSDLRGALALRQETLTGLASVFTTILAEVIRLGVDERGLIEYLLDGANDVLTSLASFTGVAKRDIIAGALETMAQQDEADGSWTVHVVGPVEAVGGWQCTRCGTALTRDKGGALPEPGTWVRVRERRGFVIAEVLRDRVTIGPGEEECRASP